MGDDLLITNKYISDNKLNGSNKEIFEKLHNSKQVSKNTYNDESPEFTDEVKINTDSGLNISENSIAFEQFVKFAEMDKKKKIKRTVINIDSKNRQKKCTFDKLRVDYTNEKPLSFKNNSDTFEIILNTYNHVSNIDSYFQLILSNLNDSEFSKLGIGKNNFEFDDNTGKPILSIVNFIDYTENEKKYNNETFDHNIKQFKYNRLEVLLPNNIDKSELKNIDIGMDVQIQIITNVVMGYLTPSHYKISLGDSYSNIYSVRLISSEIPNTSYTFNENLVETNIGNFNLKTKINNKLRWINKSDKVSIIDKNVIQTSKIINDIPNINYENNNTALHTKNFNKIRQQTNANLSDIVIYSMSVPDDFTNNNIEYTSTGLTIQSIDNISIENDDNEFRYIIINNTDNNYSDNNGVYKWNSADSVWIIDDTVEYIKNGLDSIFYVMKGDKNAKKYYKKNDNNIFIEIDYVENLRRLNSLLRTSLKSDEYNDKFPKNLRDYYIDDYYLGNYVYDDYNGVIGLTENNDSLRNINDIVNVFNENLLYKTKKNLNSFKYFTCNFYDNEYSSGSGIKIDTLGLYTMGLSSTDNSDITFLNDIFINDNMPYKIILNSMSSDNQKFVFNVYKMISSDSNTFTFNIIPIHCDIEPGSDLFTASRDSDILITVCNDIKVNEMTNLKKYHANEYDILERYYLRTDVCLYPYDDLWDNTDNIINVVFTKSVNNNDISFKFKSYRQISTGYEIIIDDGEYYLKINEKDAIVVEYVKEYDYIEIDNNFYQINNNNDVYYLNSHYNIPLINHNLTTQEYTFGIIEFQKKRSQDIRSVYISSIDIENKIIRIYDGNNIHQYVEFFVGKKRENMEYDAIYKMDTGFDFLSLTEDSKYIKLFKEDLKTYLRESVGDYLVINLENNIEYPILNGILDSRSYGSTLDAEISTNYTFNDIINRFEKNIDKINLFSDLVDITDYTLISVYSQNYETGILELSFAKEYISDEIKKIEHVNINPKIESNTNRIPAHITLSSDSSKYELDNINDVTKYPVYELNIPSGKYSADTIIKFLLEVLSSLKTRNYDYSKGIFYNDSKINKYIDLNNEYGINEECKFVISINKSVNSITFKQYKKIFDSHKSISNDNRRILYYNEGFPYIYINSSIISLPNNSILYMTGFTSIDNIKGDVLNGEKKAIRPKSYKIKMRQLLPVPRLDFLNSRQNLFSKVGYVDEETDNEMYSEYVDYINNAISSDNVKNFSEDYIVDRIFKIGESDFLDNDYLSNDKLVNNKNIFNSNKYANNAGSFYNNDLNRSFVDNYGKNVKYDSVLGYNDQNMSVVTNSNTGLEYYGQSIINGFNNKKPHNEHTDNESDKIPVYPDENMNSGVEPMFIKNELFMKLSDINTTHKENIVGRITYIDDSMDEYGNFTVEFDLFTENNLNFKIGDIVIGLDSDTVGVIVPYDYSFNSLPNIDMVSLGIGSYILNRSVQDSGIFFEKYLSISNNSLLSRGLVKRFITNVSNWQIEENKTNTGVYIYSKIVPNRSRLEGMILNNLQIYQPNFFKFLESDDTALSKFGFVSSYYNNKWDYFKSNYDINYESEIKRSFFNIAKNNELYTDYLIIETKSIQNFKVNDKIYIENHEIIHKDADYRRDKFFNIELLESFGSFISKLEMIYNSSVLNYNGKSGIGVVNNTEKDEKYLADQEYCYQDAASNNTARIIPTMSGTITNINFDSIGTGYVGIPNVYITNTGSEIEKARIVINDNINGTIQQAIITNVGNNYSNTPEIIVDPPFEQAIGVPLLNDNGEIIDVQFVGSSKGVKLSRGLGYTETPNIEVGECGTQATGSVLVDGIGTIINTEDIPSINENQIETIEISEPFNGGIQAKAYIIRDQMEYESNETTGGDTTGGDYNITPAKPLRPYGNYLGVKVYNNGNGYTQTENILITHKIYTVQVENGNTSIIESDSSPNRFSAKIDAIGTILINNKGSNYDPIYKPSINIVRSSDSNKGDDAVIFTKINEINQIETSIEQGTKVVTGGSGYKAATVSIDKPRAIVRAVLDTGITSCTIINSGNFSNNYGTISLSQKIITGLSPGIYYEGMSLIDHNQNVTASIVLTKEITNIDDILILNFNDNTIFQDGLVTLDIEKGNSLYTSYLTTIENTISIKELLSPVIHNNTLSNVIINNPGTFTDIPEPNIIGGSNVTLSIALGNLGYIKNVDIMYKGTDYTSLPSLEIEKPKRNAVVSLDITDKVINNVNVREKGSGYTAIPNINIDMGSYIHPSQNGSTISGTLGKGDITNISVLSKNGDDIPIQTTPTDPIIFLRDEDDQWKYLGEKPKVVPVYYPIDFNITGTTTQNGVDPGKPSKYHVTRFDINNSGHNILSLPYKTKHSITVGSNFNVKLEFNNGGIQFNENNVINAVCDSKYEKKPKVTIYNSIQQGKILATVTSSIGNILLKQGGNGYTTIPQCRVYDGNVYDENVTISLHLETSALSTLMQVSSIELINGGNNFTKMPNIIVDKPIMDSPTRIPFKNKYIYRSFSQNIDFYDTKYYLTYSSNSDISESEFHIETDQENNITKLYIYKNSHTTNILDIFNIKQKNEIQFLSIEDDNGNNIIYTKDLFSDVFILNENINNINLEDTNNYYIKMGVYRLPIAIDSLGDFIENRYSVNMKTSKYVKKYDTLGIFERIVDEYINKMHNNMSYNIAKSSELYRKYSYNVFRNRIIKLKVCPIDDEGFCFEKASGENVDINTGLAMTSRLSNRTIIGHSRKLFPYHEREIVKTYFKNIKGSPVDIIGSLYKNYSRVKQSLDNKQYSSKEFLRGMGIYTIKENAKSGITQSNSHYNDSTSTSRVPLVYSEYEYETNFIGYVLGTSLKNSQEYNKECRLNSDTFSKKELNDSVHSEYYIYALIDPDIKNQVDIDRLFDILNNDNVNIVFDANANSDYYERPIKSPGYLTSKRPYYVDSTNINGLDEYSNEYITRNNDKVYNIRKNIYGHTSFINSTDDIVIYESENFSNEIASTSENSDNIFEEYDGLGNILASSIKIKKNKLNKTLPNYQFQKRIACATIIEKPVIYQEEDSNSRKLFNSAEYDYFYKDYLENKTVMHYKTALNKDTLNSLNKINECITNPMNINNKGGNFKENNIHSSRLDGKMNSLDLYNNSIKYENLDFTNIEGNNPIIHFESGDDIILIDSHKDKNDHTDGPNYNRVSIQDTKKIGIKNKSTKIISGSVFPRLYFDYNKKFENTLNKFISNTSLIDLEYNSELERLTNNSLLGKYKCQSIDITGNNSNKYNQASENDILDYNKIEVKNILGNTIEINLADHLRLTNVNDCVIVISGSIKSANEKQPFDIINNSELGIIKNVVGTIGQCTLELYNPIQNTHLVDNIDQYAYILYKTVTITTSMTNSVVNVSSTDDIEEGDTVIFDWGKKRNIKKNRYPPHIVDNIEGESIYTFKKYTVKSVSQSTITIDTPYILYPKGTVIIIMKNTIENSMYNSDIKNLDFNFLSTDPFTVNNEWYTKIYYRGVECNKGEHRNNQYTKSYLLNNLNEVYTNGGEPRFSKNYSSKIYIGGMKGVGIPFVDIDRDNLDYSNPEFYSEPVSDGYYDIEIVQNEDFMLEKNTKPYISTHNGMFVKNIEQINNLNTNNKNTLNTYKWISSNNSIEFPYIIIKGFYLGYGGIIEERYDRDIINTLVNNDKYFPIKKITNLKNKQYIYLQYSSINNDVYDVSNISENHNITNQSTRNNYLDYQLNLKFLDSVFLNDQLSEYQENISIVGINGKILTRKIKVPYDLNPDNYIYLVIPSLSHIKTVQNSNIQDTFAKIILPGDSNRTLYNSFIAGTKIFYNNLYNNLSELEIAFITNDGFLFDFNGSNHSLTLEITEIIDKFEYINPKFGNIEI